MSKNLHLWGLIQNFCFFNGCHKRNKKTWAPKVQQTKPNLSPAKPSEVAKPESVGTKGNRKEVLESSSPGNQTSEWH